MFWRKWALGSKREGGGEERLEDPSRVQGSSGARRVASGLEMRPHACSWIKASPPLIPHAQRPPVKVRMELKILSSRGENEL